MDQIIQLQKNQQTYSRHRGEHRIEIDLPILHADQLKAWSLGGRHKAIRCGRRWGKTLLCEAIACKSALSGKLVGWFAPEYKFLAEAFTDISQMLSPAIVRASRMEGVMRLVSGGRIDFWSLENERAGRSRRYHLVIIDEAAFAKATMTDVWRKSIEPTLLDYKGRALAASNTNGLDIDNWFYRVCSEPEWGFKEYWAPSANNPYLPADEIDALRERTHPLVFEQEYEAKFVDWSGAAFFSQLSLLVDGKPVEYPSLCDGVFAVIDTAVKDKSEHDGTGVLFCAINEHFAGPRLVLLDYDLIQIEGSLLEAWLPGVYVRLEELAKACRARFGSLGCWIEDKNSGTILLQQARRRGWTASPIESDLTKLGKDARCISVSGYVHRGDVKMSAPCYDRVITYKGTTRNHLLSQVVGYRVGIDQGEDDLLDTFAYSCAIALGDKRGF